MEFITLTIDSNAVQIFKIPYNGQAVFTNDWDLGSLQYSQETEGPYFTDLPTPDDIRRLLELECVMRYRITLSGTFTNQQRGYYDLSACAPNTPSKIPSTKDTSSSSIDYIPKSPTSSTSLLPNGYLNPPTSPPPRVSPPPPTQENASMDITLTLSLITPLDVQFDTPSPSPPIIGHPILWNLLEAHGDSCLCCIHNRTLIFGLRDEHQYMFSYIEHMLSQLPIIIPPPPPSSTY
ncbi:hypothetical protein Tco_1002762 [Tanacetum coccineum]|uniref:Uncharacterized protein n=1 Tax=Tanacetum coccineum TaxID=301880 RepID=A0ABQ5F831_9ASTR